MKRLLLAAACLAGCARDEDAAPAEHATAQVEASVAAVSEATFHEVVEAVGDVAGRPGHVAQLAAPAPARIATVFVTSGAAVKAGDPLVALEQLPFTTAVTGAKAAADVAERSAERARRLSEAGVLPRKEYEAAQAELTNARNTLANAERTLELATLHSPITGTVTRLNAVLGASADPSQLLVEVSDQQALDVRLTVSPGDAARIRGGQAVEIYPGTAAAGDPVASGRVADVGGMVDSASGGVAVRIAVSTTTRRLRIGEPVFGRIAVVAHAGAVVVPLDALVPTGEGFRVFIVDGDGVAHATTVTVGGRSDGGAWITAGLKAGDRIVTKGAYGVDDSAKVVTKGTP